jgi:hypothetical protein
MTYGQGMAINESSTTNARINVVLVFVINPVINTCYFIMYDQKECKALMLFPIITS